MKKKRILAMILAVASCLSLAVSASAAGTTTARPRISATLTVLHGTPKL